MTKEEVKEIIYDELKEKGYNLDLIDGELFNDITDVIVVKSLLFGVAGSLPNKKESDIEVYRLVDVIFGDVKECEKKINFIIGFRTCYRWLINDFY
jgi:hypothetical protein